MSPADKVVKSVVYILGALATAGFLITKNATLLGWATAGDSQYGDLYRFAKIARFKPKVPLARGPSSDRDSIDQGELHPAAEGAMLLGDSFSFRDAGGGTLGEQLQQRTGTPFFCIYNNNHRRYWENPELLMERPAKAVKGERVLVYEAVERLIEGEFYDARPTNAVQEAPGRQSQRSMLSAFNNDMFSDTESRNELLWKHGILSSPLVAGWDTAVFELFRRIPMETPWYSLQPPFLFYKDEVACFRTYHDEKLVARLADNIALFARDLRERSGYRLFFVPVPNKVTLYSRLVTDKDYDGFLPRLCSELKKRGVRNVDLLPVFQKEGRLLYSPTDTHWNDLGIRIAVQQVFENWPQPESK